MDIPKRKPPHPTIVKYQNSYPFLKRYCNREYGENIWQSSCHDHIIRGQNDYQKIWEYVDTNVLRCEKDCFYTDEKE